MDVIKLDISIDIQKIKNEIETLEYDDQICLQGFTKEMDPFYGSRRINEFENSFQETDFDVFLFDNLKYLNSIISKLNMKRTRIMRFKPKTCLSWHHDLSWRIHIPIITNESCFLLIDRTSHHLSAGHAYKVNTMKWHTALNASFDERIHIVGVLDNNGSQVTL